MKKLFLVFTCLLVVAVLNAQSLEEIVKKYSAAMKYDQKANTQTIKVTGKASGMGMEMPLTMFMKNPDKIRIVNNVQGQDYIATFDGEKGYATNPMQGTIELDGNQAKQVKNKNEFNNDLLNYFRSGKLTLEGDENVNGKPAFKLKADIEGGNPIYMFVDKDTYLLVKLSMKVEQMGQAMDIDLIMSDYVDINGVVMPRKITTSSSGMEFGVTTYDNIEVNVPMDDSIFKLK
jgi:outer membrane lipoprotein-sorting protein